LSIRILDATARRWCSVKRLAAAVIILVGLLASGAATQALWAGTASALPGGGPPTIPSFFWMATSNGSVLDQSGRPGQYGSADGSPLNAPVVGLAAMPFGVGYRLVAGDGGVFTYGSAGFFGSMGGQHLNAPVVGMANTGDGGGYWLVAADGGVFSFGDANFYGSAGGTHLNAPVVGIAATSDSGGYWLVAADGGVFSYGDATFYGSAGGTHLNAPVVGIAATPDGGGYWLVAADGGVFSYGDAGFYGSKGGQTLTAPMAGIAPTPYGRAGGYTIVGSDASWYEFGPDGDAFSSPFSSSVVGLVAVWYG
jgi:hypothetical protein